MPQCSSCQSKRAAAVQWRKICVKLIFFFSKILIIHFHLAAGVRSIWHRIKQKGKGFPPFTSVQKCTLSASCRERERESTLVCMYFKTHIKNFYPQPFSILLSPSPTRHQLGTIPTPRWNLLTFPDQIFRVSKFDLCRSIYYPIFRKMGFPSALGCIDARNGSIASRLGPGP